MPCVIDLCSGLGGLSLAAKQLGFEVLAGVDLNEDALKTFARNFPGARALHGSVRSSKILDECGKLFTKAKISGAATVIVSGPPCQGFSVAGPRDPIDPRNQVLIAVARAIVTLQPECALVENVAAILGDDNAERLDLFENTIFRGGYGVFNLLLDASDFGVPQKRRRAFFLITKRTLDAQLIGGRLNELKKVAPTVAATLRGLPKPCVRPNDYDDEKCYGTVANHVAMQHSSSVKSKIAKIKPGTGPMSYRRLHPDRYSNTLFSGHRAPPAHFSEARSITVREAARLQGFPDTFRIYGGFGKQMEQVSNAVPPPLASAVLQILLENSGIQFKITHG